MKKLTFVKIFLFFTFAFFLASDTANAQCDSWVGSPKESEASDAHTIYRGHMKNKDFDAAYDHWKTAYTIAPAADGKRDFHYTDGIKLNKHKFSIANDADKKMLSSEILKLYDEAISCFESGAIKMKTPANSRIAYLLGRKAYDMYYELQSPYPETFKVLEAAAAKGGNDSEYIILAPYAAITVYMYTNKLIDEAAARKIYATVNEIADHQIANNEKYASYYQQAKDAANGSFAEIENNIFDCAYFKDKMKPTYDADPDNPEVIKEVIQVLKRQGCTSEDAFMQEIEGKWAKYAAEENARLKAEFEANNPAVMAKKEYDAGNYSGAIAKYREAIDQETEDTKKADYYFRIASIQGRKLNKYNDARSTARTAAKLRANWGRPYMLIGDLYAKSGRNCGDSFMQRCAILAAIDKYSYAKSIDSAVASEANSRISKYNGSKPTKDEAFMRGYTSGQSVKVSCWIGETVKLRF